MQISLFFVLYYKLIGEMVLDLNNSYYETLNTNFNEALNLIEGSFEHCEIIEFLKNGNIPQKQAAALRLGKLTSAEDAQILLSNLTGQDGKIREAVSNKVKELLLAEKLNPYLDENCDYYAKIFADAVADINGNVCRNIITSLKILKENDNFCYSFCPLLLGKINEIILLVKKIDFQDGKYKINKEGFKLYWYLEALFVMLGKISLNDVKQILLQTCGIDEYTIREKTAKILTCCPEDEDLDKIRYMLKNDKNYYVRRF